MANSKHFYLSAFIAFFLYFSLVFLFFYYTTLNDVKKIDAIAKTTVLQLDVILEAPKEDIQKLAISNSSNNEIAKEFVKKAKSVSAKQRSNLKSLFANTNIKSKSVSKNDILNVKKSSIASRYKSKFEKAKKQNNISLSQLQNKKVTSSKTKQVVTESKNESDPYFSKIYNIISARWNPIVFYKDSKAKVLITIGNNGTFSYQFIQYSDNIGFDTQLKKFLDQQRQKYFPVNPNKKATQIEITFQAKGD